jgi:hypothetical protein
MKHTPKRWKVYRGRLRPQFPMIITEIHDEQGNVIVRWQGFDGMKKKVVAINASILAAAPDLLGACEMWMKYNSECFGQTPVPDPVLRADYRKKAIELSTIAISKTKGVTWTRP